jgi:hypothetical protein
MNEHAPGSTAADMVSVEVVMHGNLRRFLPGGVGSVRLDVPAGTTIAETIRLLRAEGEVWLAAIDNVVVAASTALTSNVALDFFAVLEGG